eukprot:gene12938-8794_t
MAIVVVQVGQCGNQLGDELFSQLALAHGLGITPPAGTPPRQPAAPKPHNGASPFFTSSGFARCVLVDAEPKVVHGVLKRHPHFIRTENVIFGQSGRGNNWGLGYYGVNDPRSKRHEGKSAGETRAFRNLHKGQRVADDGLFSNALRAIHNETRRTGDLDDFEAIVLLHSLSGGTGSGLASRLAERIRLYFVEPPDGEPEVDEVHEEKMRRIDGLDGMLTDKRRARYFISIPLAPMAVGELATQGINATLTLHVLLQKVDAILLLRNDDVLSPGEAASSSTSAGAGGAALLPKCTTFKEANELLAGLLLPVLRYGQSPGCIETLLHQCAPRGAADTGDGRILTLLPTPQRVYERFRCCAHRARFYGLHGGKDFLPGCEPEFPSAVILTAAALQRGPGGEDGGDTGGSRRSVGGKGAKRRPLWQAVSRRPRRAADPMSFDYEEEVDEESSHSASRRRPGEEEEQENASYHASRVAVPPALREYFASLRRSPAAAFFSAVEGVAVLNQARELNKSLLFPLLFSAAVKVKVGAYLNTYQDVGVTSARIEKAYRAVAEAQLNVEEVG